MKNADLVAGQFSSDMKLLLQKDVNLEKELHFIYQAWGMVTQ